MGNRKHTILVAGNIDDKGALAKSFDETAALIKAQTKRTCGNCEYAKRLDLQSIECHGVPPVPVVAGVIPGQFGKVSLNIELMRARLAIAEPACALWALNPVSPMLNLPGMAKA